MKRLIYIFSFIGLTLTLLSLGFAEHQSIGENAENTLTTKAKLGVSELLGDESLADLSTWVDQVRHQPEYKLTASWHFLNLPLGLTVIDFQKQVDGMETGNIYGALLKAEHELIYPGTRGKED